MGQSELHSLICHKSIKCCILIYPLFCYHRGGTKTISSSLEYICKESIGVPEAKSDLDVRFAASVRNVCVSDNETNLYFKNTNKSQNGTFALIHPSLQLLLLIRLA